MKRIVFFIPNHFDLKIIKSWISSLDKLIENHNIKYIHVALPVKFLKELEHIKTLFTTPPELSIYKWQKFEANEILPVFDIYNLTDCDEPHYGYPADGNINYDTFDYKIFVTECFSPIILPLVSYHVWFISEYSILNSNAIKCTIYEKLNYLLNLKNSASILFKDEVNPNASFQDIKLNSNKFKKFDLQLFLTQENSSFRQSEKNTMGVEL